MKKAAKAREARFTATFTSTKMTNRIAGTRLIGKVIDVAAGGCGADDGGGLAAEGGQEQQPRKCVPDQSGDGDDGPPVLS